MSVLYEYALVCMLLYLVCNCIHVRCSARALLIFASLRMPGGGADDGARASPASARHRGQHTADLRTKILDFKGFDSSSILILGGGILMSIE